MYGPEQTNGYTFREKTKMKNPYEGPNNPEQNLGIMGAVERLELYYRTPYLAVDLNSWSIFYRKRSMSLS